MNYTRLDNLVSDLQRSGVEYVEEFKDTDKSYKIKITKKGLKYFKELDKKLKEK